MWESMAQHEYDKPLISYKAKTNDKYLIRGSLGWESSIPQGPGPGVLSGLLPLPSDSTSVNKLRTRDGMIQAGGRLRRKHERRACLLCGPGFRIPNVWLYPTFLASQFFVFSASAFGKHIRSPLPSVSLGIQHCTWVRHFLLLPSCPSQNM